MRNAERCGRQTQNHSDDDDPAERFGIISGEPLSRVTEHVPIPQIDETSERNMFETSAAEVPCLRLRHNPDLFSGCRETTTVVDVFEPCRPELFVERTDVVDNFAADQKRRRGRLIDAPRRRPIELAIA